jgi:hypothetical protein
MHHEKMFGFPPNSHRPEQSRLPRIRQNKPKHQPNIRFAEGHALGKHIYIQQRTGIKWKRKIEAEVVLGEATWSFREVASQIGRERKSNGRFKELDRSSARKTHAK